MISRVFEKARHILSFDPKLAYYRDHVRRKILHSDPLAQPTDRSAELHVLTSEKDWVNLMWSLKSFYHFVDKPYALAVHGDASLPKEAVDAFKAHFPQARVIEQSSARQEVLDGLGDYPQCKKFRETNTLSIKVFDFLHYLSADKMILFDSDLLFFKKPEAFLERLERTGTRVNSFNRDVATAYAIEKSQIEQAGKLIADEVNSGFGIVHKDSMPLEWLEEFLSIPGMIDGHFWRIEQTMYALCASRFGVELLPDEYRVFLDGPVEGRPFRHYVGAIRDQMYVEGMRKLAPVICR